MSNYDQRVDKTKALIQGAREVVEDDFTDDQRALAPEDLRRLSEVLDYAEQVVSRTRPTLVPDTAWDQLDSNLESLRQEASTNPENFVQARTRAFATELGVALAQFPPARGRISEQQASATLDKVRQQAESRINQLKNQLNEVAGEEASLREAMDLRGSELGKSIETEKERLQQAIAEVEAELNNERQRIESTTTEQAETFRKAQENRENEFRALLDRQDANRQELETKTTEQIEGLLDEIERMRDQSAELVGAIGVTGTAERYKGEADHQRMSADTWRWVAVAIAGIAVIVAIWAALTAGPDSEDVLPFIGKLAIGAALGGLATYAAKQSGRHRDREETAKSIQLDLAAFDAFIQPLDKSSQDKEREELGRRIFGQHFTARELKLKDGGPGTVEQIVQMALDRLRSSGELPPPP